MISGQLKCVERKECSDPREGIRKLEEVYHLIYISGEAQSARCILQHSLRLTEFKCQR